MWRDALECATGVYVKRWIAETPWFSVRVHHWLGNDDPRAWHDHPWSFVTLVLWGGYVDASAAGNDTLRVGSIRFRPAEWAHTVALLPNTTCWTLVVTGPIVRHFGFWWTRADGTPKWVKANKHFKEHGKFPCSD